MDITSETKDFVIQINTDFEFKIDEIANDFGGLSMDTERLVLELGQKLITQDHARLREHSERIGRDPALCQTYTDVVLASRNDHADPERDLAIRTAASNAISVLNYGSRCGFFSFHFVDIGDWSGIRVPKANLNYAVMAHCNLNDADLSGSSMIGITLCHSQLQRANLLGIKEHLRAGFSRRYNGFSEVNLTPDGHVIAYSDDSSDETAQVLNMETNECMGHLNGLTKSMTILNFSRDGDYMVSVGSADGAIRIWNTRTYECEATLQLDEASASSPQCCAAFNPDHCRLATTWRDGLIHIWDIETSQTIHTLQHPDVIQLDWSPRGDRIASRSHSDGRILLWDVETYTPVLTMKQEMTGSFLHNFQFSGDGRYILFSDYDIHVWDATTGLHKATLKGHTDIISGLVCDPDGHHAYSCGDTTIRTWNLVTNECICVLRQHSSFIDYLTLSADGRRLFSYATSGITAAIWNTEALKLQLPVVPELNGYRAVLSPDHLSLAIAHDRFMSTVYSTETGQLTTILPHCDGNHWSVQSLCYSFDGKMLAGIGSNARVYIWDFTAGRYLTEFDHDSMSARLLCFSPTKNLLAVGGLSDVELWDFGTFQRTALCTQPQDIGWIGFSPDGCILGIASGQSRRSNDLKTIQLWNTTTMDCVVTISDNTIWPDAVSFSPCGRFIACGARLRKVRVLSTKTGARVSSITTHGHFRICFHPSGQIIATDGFLNVINTCDLASRKCYTTNARKGPFVNADDSEVTFMSHDGRLMALTFAEMQVDLWEFPELQWKSEIVLNGYASKMPTTIVGAPNTKFDRSLPNENMFGLASGSSVDGDIFVQGSHHASTAILKGHSEMVTSMTLSHTAEYLVSGSCDGTIRVWNLATYECTQAFEGHTNTVTCTQFSPDDKLIASGSHDMTIRVWSITETKCIHHFEGHISAIKKVIFSPDMTHIASIGSVDHVIRVWDMTTGVCFMILDQHTDEIFDIQYSPDSNYLASGSHDGTIRVWETKTSECISTLKGHRDCLTCFVMTSDGKTIVSGAEDNTVRVWNIATGKCNFILRGHTGHIRSLCLTPDDRCIISTSADHVIHIWNLATGDLLHQLYGHTDTITLVKLFHYDAEKESTLVSISHDSTVRLWMVRSMPVYVKYVPKLRNIIGRPKCINLIDANVTGAQMDQDVSRLFKAHGAYSVNRAEVCFMHENVNDRLIPEVDSEEE